MYVAVKGGEAAIHNAHKLLADRRRGDRSLPSLTLAQIAEQLALACDRVMAEGSVYDKELAALAIKQARGDLIEAIFLLRAYRTTLPRFGYSVPIDTAAMQVERRVSATYKDLPGGQMLGPTFDYTHRLLDPELARDEEIDAAEIREGDGAPVMRVSDILAQEGLIEEDGDVPGDEIGDLTRTPMEFPMERDTRLQALARGDEGFLLALGYSTQRGYARSHPFVGEIRIGEVDVKLDVPELGFAVTLGRIQVTECQMVNQFKGSAKAPPQFTRGYGLVFGQSERKAMAMALCDRALRASELGEDIVAPAQDEEFVISHSDNVQATGFVEHLKLPHYVDFQAELDLVRRMRNGEHATAPEWRGLDAGGGGMTTDDRNGRRAGDLQFRLSRRADEADDPPRDPQGDRHTGLPGAVRLARDADALWLGHRRRAGDRLDHRP
jgi:alpha-D-ribose 1-methylphosphonate 5-triphosphate synthase subunit PhnI